jgi:hypothetical protein
MKGLRQRSPDIAVLGVFCVLTVVMTWPLVTQMSTHLPGHGDDLLVHYWNGWRTKRLLAQGGKLYHTDLLFHPTGVSLLYANLSWINIAIWLLLEPLFGGITAFNLFYLLNLALCGMGMYILMRYLTRSRGAALVAGLIYAFWPYRLFEIGHPNLITTQWLPLFLLSVIRVVREKKQKIKHALLVAVFLILTGYTRWQLLVFAAVIAGLYGFYSLWFEREYWDVHVVTALALAIVLSLLAIAPPVYPIIRGQLTRQHPEDLFVTSLVPKQTDLLGYVIPPHNHLLEEFFKNIKYTKGFTRAWYSNAYLGIFVVLLVGIGLRRTRRMGWFWGGLMLATFLLAVGPAPRVNKHIYSNVTLPYALVEDFFFVKIMRVPRRWNMLLALPIAAIAGYGVLFLQDRIRSLELKPPHANVGFILLVILICLDYLQIPVDTFDTEISPFYETLATYPERFGLLNLPTGRDRSPYYMFCQTIHGKPIVEGSIARPPRQAKAFVEDNPFLVYLRDHRLMNPDYPDISRQLSILTEANIRYLIINELYAFPWEKKNWRTYITYEPIYSDRFISVYRTNPKVGRDFELTQEIHNGIGLTEVISSTDFIGLNSSMEATVIWGTTKPQNEEFMVDLSLVDADNRPRQTVTFPPVRNWPTDEWPINVLARGHYTFRVDPRLPSGVYTLTLVLSKPDTREQVGKRAVIDEGLEMDLPPREFTPPSSQVEVDVQFGDVLKLLGYDLDIEDNGLMITLHWQALRRMKRSYKFFVHLYERESGEIVAQKDAVPRNWSYPTTWWEAKEVVSDESHLSLGKMSVEDYQLAVGIYDAETGKRLPIVSHPPYLAVDERRLFLKKKKAQ